MDLQRAFNACWACTVCDRESTCVVVLKQSCSYWLVSPSRNISEVTLFSAGSCLGDRVQDCKPKCFPSSSLLFVLGCDCAGRASSFISSYLALSHAKLWNRHISQVCVFVVGDCCRPQQQLLFVVRAAEGNKLGIQKKCCFLQEQSHKQGKMIDMRLQCSLSDFLDVFLLH